MLFFVYYINVKELSKNVTIVYNIKDKEYNIKYMKISRIK